MGRQRKHHCMFLKRLAPFQSLFEDSRRFEFVKPSSLKWLARESLLRQEMDSAYWPLTSDVDGIYSLWCNPETKKNVTNINFTTRTPTRLQKKETNIHLKTQTSALGNKKDQGSSPNASLSQTSTKNHFQHISQKSTPSKQIFRQHEFTSLCRLEFTGSVWNEGRVDHVDCNSSVGRAQSERSRFAWLGWPRKTAVKIMSSVCTFVLTTCIPNVESVWFEISRKMTPSYPPHI